MTRSVRSLSLLALALLQVYGCSSKAADVSAGGSDAGRLEAGHADVGRFDAGISDNPSHPLVPAPLVAGNTNAAAGSGAAQGSAGAANTGPEVCDGIDNDGDGIIDNVDAQHDGLCDCLNIATIGEIGPWSDGGNVFKTWLNSRSPTPAVELADKVITDDLLKPLQIVVVLYAGTLEFTGNGRTLPAHHAFSDAEVAAFQRWVEHGGGVMTTIGYTADEANELVNVNRLLAPLGMAYSTTKLGEDGYVQQWIQHPVTDQVLKIFTANGVEPDGASATTLAFDASMRVALQVVQPHDGHVVVWGDEWITYDSQWQAVQDQQVERLWLNIFKWLSPPLVCQVPIVPS
jgi:hypothetical protein